MRSPGISVTLKRWEKIVEGLPRDVNGKIRRGALKDRVDRLINNALDKEQTSCE